LVCKHNKLSIDRYTACSGTIPAGRRRIEVDTTIERPGAPAGVVLSVDGKEVGRRPG
jgi:arylsulfatase